jgi:hypothetical protein
MPGHQLVHQSRSRRESNLVRDVPGEDILVGTSVKEEVVGAEAAAGAREAKAAGATETTRAEATAAGAREAKAAGATETTRAEATAAGAREAKAAGATETTRAEATAGVRTTPAVKRAILVEEGIQARAEEEARDVDPTRAFFIRIILRVLWRRVLR